MTTTIRDLTTAAGVEPSPQDVVETAPSYVDYYNLDALLTPDERAIRDDE